MGSGSTDLLAPSPVIIDAPASPIVVDSPPAIDIDSTSPTDIDMPPPATVKTPSLVIVGSSTSAIINIFPCATGSTLSIAGVFELAIGSLNFHVDDADISRLLLIVEPTMPDVDSVVPSPAITQQAVKDNFTPVSPLLSSGMGQAPESSSPLVGSNTFQDLPLSPTTAYCDAYHFMGAGYFSSHELLGCGDPRGCTATIYPTISECQRALDALTLQPTPYDPNYAKGLYSEYTCSNNDFYPKMKGKVKESDSSSLANSALTGSGYIIDFDRDMLIDTRSYFGAYDIYPLTRGEIEEHSPSPAGKHYIMASHGEGSESSVHGGRDRRTASGRIINQAQI
jgi:hypothetical protein